MNTTAIRASSLSSLFDCPARFEATQIKGLRTPSSSKSVLGRAVHASTAVYDIARLGGDLDFTPAEAAGAAVDVILKPEEDVVWDEGLPPSTVENIALGLHSLYCSDIAPTINYAAVEVTCEALNISDLKITLTGTVDRVYISDEGKIGIADIKTGAQAVAADGTVKTSGHSFQLGVYELLAEAATGRPVNAPAKIIGLQTGKTPKGQRAGIGRIECAKEALLGDEDTSGALETAAHIIKSGLFHGNPRSMMCHSKYCPLFSICRYRR